MSLLIDTNTIVTRGLAAIARAERYYARVSCGRTVRSAPESFLQAEIFRSLVGATFPRITLEETTAQVLRDLQSANEENIEAIRNGRIDILLWKRRANGTFVPRYPIEVKKITGLDSLEEDIKRLLILKQISPQGRKICRAFVFACCIRDTPDSAEDLLTNVSFPSEVGNCYIYLNETVSTTRRNGTSATFGSACYYF